MTEITSQIDDKFVTFLMNEMNNKEQKLFAQNFMYYLKFGDDPSAFVIDFNDV